MLFFKDIKKDFNLLEKINIQNKLFYIIVINFLTSVIEMISLASLVPLVGIVMKGEIPEKFNWIFAYEFLQDNNNFLILVGLIILVKTIFVISTAYYKENSIKLISIKLSDYIFLKFFNKDWDYISKKNTSFFVKNILNEVDVYSKYLNSQLTFFAEFFILIFVLFFLLFMQPIITIIVITFFSFIFALGYSIVKKNIKRLGETREFSQKKILQRIIETISNYPLIKIFKQKNFFLK
jgi:ABC-type multidrug transport system fused ATPase/permease subunit